MTKNSHIYKVIETKIQTTILSLGQNIKEAYRHWDKSHSVIPSLRIKIYTVIQKLIQNSHIDTVVEMKKFHNYTVI